MDILQFLSQQPDRWVEPMEQDTNLGDQQINGMTGFYMRHLMRHDLYPTFLKILPAYYDRLHPTERGDWLVRKNQMDSVHQLRCTLSHQPKQGIK